MMGFLFGGMTEGSFCASQYNNPPVKSSPHFHIFLIFEMSREIHKSELGKCYCVAHFITFSVNTQMQFFIYTIFLNSFLHFCIESIQYYFIVAQIISLNFRSNQHFH